MNTINAQLVQEPRRRTGAGMMTCKTVLQETGCDLDRAVEVLRKQGIAKAESRETRTTGEGGIGSYVHHNGKIAAIVEVNCETDFVARTAEFEALLRLLAEQVAATAPLAVEWSGVPVEISAEKRLEYERQVRASGEPEPFVDRLVEKKLEAFAREVVLMRQSWIREPRRTIGDLVAESAARLGEAVRVKRFARFAVGEQPHPRAGV